MGVLMTIEGQHRYNILRKICEGGMGVVFEAEQLGTRGFTKRLAIKIIRDSLARQSKFLDNFIGEARLVADLIHTNIVQTYHLGEDRGRYYIAMEFIHGVNLEQFAQALARQKMKLPPELAVFIASRVARGLAYAHAKRDAQGRSLGIVHRDVSYKNIMIAFEGDVKLMDFGIAKAIGFLTDEEGQVSSGKPEYMSPEQADFQVTDARSDLFSAGVVLSELLLGRNLFREATPEATRASILKRPIPQFCELDSRIDEALNAILQKALNRDVDRRYQTAGELLHDLEYYIYHQGYGPTNETLGSFVRGLCSAAVPAPAPIAKGDTALLERTARIH
jgi:serine/threonine-protein kinase